VISGDHSPVFEALCDDLADTLHAERAHLPGAGHTTPMLAAPSTTRSRPSSPVPLARKDESGLVVRAGASGRLVERGEGVRVSKGRPARTPMVVRRLRLPSRRAQSVSHVTTALPLHGLERHPAGTARAHRAIAVAPGENLSASTRSPARSSIYRKSSGNRRGSARAARPRTAQ
jgi:hypothetical protein